jgi:hypothetical protein
MDCGAPDETTAKMYAFVHAAIWADDIKTKPYGYTRDTVTSSNAGQNIGYADHNQHALIPAYELLPGADVSGRVGY